MFSILPTVSCFTAITSFIINLLLLNCTLNPNIRTIVIYHDNHSSHEFVNTVLNTISDMNKPFMVVDLSKPPVPDFILIGHQIIRVFLWKDLNVSKHLSYTSTIQNSETVIFVFEEPQHKRDIEALAQDIWELYKLFNTILVYHDINRNITDLVTFRPFQGKFVSVRDVKDVILEQLYGETLIPIQIDMKRYNISVLLIVRSPNVLRLNDTEGKHFKYGGRDGRMASFLSHYYNTSFKYITKATTKVLVVQQDGGKNVTKFVPVHAVQDSDIFIVDDEVRPMALNVTADILMNSRMCCDIANNYVPFYPHEFDSYVVLVPSAVSFIGLHHIYHPNTFWLGFVAVVIFSVVWIIFQCILYRDEKRTVSDYEKTFLDVLGMCLLTYEAKVSSYISERILVTFVLFFATVMSIIEAAVIYDTFVTDITISEIDTLKELEYADCPILITADAKVLMEYGKVSQKLQEKFILTDKHDITYDILSGDTTQCYVLRRSRAKSLLQRYSLQKEGYSIFHIVKEPLLPSLLSYYARNTFPFADDFNQLVQRSIENGFLQHFDEIEKYKFYFMDNHRKEIDNDRKNREKVIELPEIMSTLMIFMAGLGMSICVFVLELVWAKLEPKVKEWIELRKEMDLMEAIQKQNEGFVNEKLFEFIE